MTSMVIAHHLIWTAYGWWLFPDSPDDVIRTIRYVQNNPLKARIAPQSWDFVSRYDDWPFHKRR